MLKTSCTLAILCLAFLACKNDPKPPPPPPAPKAAAPATAPAPPDGSAAFILTEGAVSWVSTNTIGNGKHKGAIKISRGEVWVKEGQILYGNAILDMNSVSADIPDAKSKLELEEHLKNADFFETNMFPKAEFMFIEVLPGTKPNTNWVLNGNLTMRGITAPVSVPVKVTVEGDVLRAESPDFSINRTTWGVNFHSGLLGTTKDKMVDDLVTLRLKVMAKKK